MNEPGRPLSAIVNTEGFDVEILDNLHQVMDDWEDEFLGSPSAINKTVLHIRNFWVVKNLLTRLILHLTGTQNDPSPSSSIPPAAPTNTKKMPPPPPRTVVGTHQGKAAITIASEYKKTEPLLVKNNPSNTSISSSEEDTSSDSKSPGKDGGQTSVNPRSFTHFHTMWKGK